MVMVTSFNECYDDTQIEATAGGAGTTTRDDSESGRFYTEGQKYADYGTLYLDILRQEIKRAVPRESTHMEQAPRSRELLFHSETARDRMPGMKRW